MVTFSHIWNDLNQKWMSLSRWHYEHLDKITLLSRKGCSVFTNIKGVLTLMIHKAVTRTPRYGCAFWKFEWPCNWKQMCLLNPLAQARLPRNIFNYSVNIVKYPRRIHSVTLHSSAVGHLVQLLCYTSVPYTVISLDASWLCCDITTNRNAPSKSTSAYATSDVHLTFTADKLLPFKFWKNI